jgi:3'-phosphoadenosine 5'-phosphosulfate sulfotransferase (PAPS reductase)/FAD synthetase
MELWQLQQLQGLPLEVKIRKTQERIKEWYEHWNGQVYISFSGGKDSTVLLHIARQMYPDVEAVFVDTGLEYPEIRDFVKTFDNVTWLKPKMNFKQVIDKYGYPVISKNVSQAIYEARNKPDGQKALQFNPQSDYCKKYGDRYNLEKWTFLKDSDIPISHKCCHELKKKPAKLYEKATEKKPIVGTMTNESLLRQTEWLRSGCNSYDGKRPMGKPLSFWTEQDILHYIMQNNLPIASCYGEIIEGDQLEGQTVLDGCMTNLTTSKCKRTGCMFCMFGVHLEKEPNRFQMMKETHPKQYDYCINKLGLGEVLDYIGVKY